MKKRDFLFPVLATILVMSLPQPSFSAGEEKTDSKKDAHEYSWRFGFGGGAYSGLFMEDKDDEISSIPANGRFFVQFCAVDSKESSTRDFGYAGFRLEYDNFSTDYNDTVELSGSLYKILAMARGKTRHSYDFTFGVTAAMLEFSLKDAPAGSGDLEETTGITLSGRIGYSFAFSRHIYWSVIGFEPTLFLYDTEGIEFYDTSFGIWQFSSELSFVL